MRIGREAKDILTPTRLGQLADDGAAQIGQLAFWIRQDESIFRGPLTRAACRAPRPLRGGHEEEGRVEDEGGKDEEVEGGCRRGRLADGDLDPEFARDAEAQAIVVAQLPVALVGPV